MSAIDLAYTSAAELAELLDRLDRELAIREIAR